jgi:hypothetical protein
MKKSSYSMVLAIASVFNRSPPILSTIFTWQNAITSSDKNNMIFHVLVFSSQVQLYNVLQYFVELKYSTTLQPAQHLGGWKWRYVVEGRLLLVKAKIQAVSRWSAFMNEVIDEGKTPNNLVTIKVLAVSTSSAYMPTRQWWFSLRYWLSKKSCLDFRCLLNIETEPNGVNLVFVISL